MSDELLLLALEGQRKEQERRALERAQTEQWLNNSGNKKEAKMSKHT